MLLLLNYLLNNACCNNGHQCWSFYINHDCNLHLRSDYHCCDSRCCCCCCCCKPKTYDLLLFMSSQRSLSTALALYMDQFYVNYVLTIWYCIYRQIWIVLITITIKKFFFNFPSEAFVYINAALENNVKCYKKNCACVNELWFSKIIARVFGKELDKMSLKS